MPHRTRAELEKLMDANSAVRLPDGRLITNKANLPSDAELAAVHRDHVLRVHEQRKAEGAKDEELKKLMTEADEADALAGKHSKAAAKAAKGPEADAGDGFHGCTKDDLRDLCEKNGVECPASATKPEIIKALTDAGVKAPE